MLLALRIAGLEPRKIAVSGAILAVVFGLAAQQTLGNLIAGVVLISARPFKVGDRVRLQSGGLAGEIDGVVSALGLLYTTFARGEDSIMVPNNIVLASAVVPLREPSSVNLRARLRPDVIPSEVQELLDEHITTAVRSEPTSASRRSTATRSWSVSPPRRRPTPTASGSPTRSSPRSPRLRAKA
jgi:small conductance mechanosensitive channel